MDNMVCEHSFNQILGPNHKKPILHFELPFLKSLWPEGISSEVLSLYLNFIGMIIQIAEVA